jgi:hypothetical protein
MTKQPLKQSQNIWQQRITPTVIIIITRLILWISKCCYNHFKFIGYKLQVAHRRHFSNSLLTNSIVLRIDMFVSKSIKSYKNISHA